VQDDVVDTTALTSVSGMASSEAVVADRYQLGLPLGQGAMANVYRAVDLRLNRDVAIKLFHPGQDATVRIRFGAEAQALARLSHPGLVGIYDAGVDDDDRPYLVMDLVDGESLRDRLLGGPLTAPEAMALGARLAAALAHVHANDVVHRDVKPSNIVLDAQAQPHLADFGIALLLDAARMTGSNEILGTAAYLAPEQILGDPVGAPADVYSLGLVLLECLTGELEYPGVSKVEFRARPPAPPATGAGRCAALARFAAQRHDRAVPRGPSDGRRVRHPVVGWTCVVASPQGIAARGARRLAPFRRRRFEPGDRDHRVGVDAHVTDAQIQPERRDSRRPGPPLRHDGPRAGRRGAAGPGPRGRPDGRRGPGIRRRPHDVGHAGQRRHGGDTERPGHHQRPGGARPVTGRQPDHHAHEDQAPPAPHPRAPQADNDVQPELTEVSEPVSVPTARMGWCPPTPALPTTGPPQPPPSTPSPITA